MDAAWEAVRLAKFPRVHIFLATSQIHMEYKLKMTPDQVIHDLPWVLLQREALQVSTFLRERTPARADGYELFMFTMNLVYSFSFIPPGALFRPWWASEGKSGLSRKDLGI